VATGLFFAGLIAYLFPVNDTVLTVASVTMVSVITIVYLAILLLPFVPDASFTTLKQLFLELVAIDMFFFVLLFSVAVAFIGSYMLPTTWNFVLEQNNPCFGNV
jgi:hypothetical protein